MQLLSIKLLGNSAFCLSLVMFTGSLLAQDMSSMKMGHSADSKFAMEAAHGGEAEVEMGKLASEKASDPDVKAFGEKMVLDHSKANEQLMSIAKGKSMTLPNDMNAKQKLMYTKLKALSGSAFDKAYVTAMVKDHEEDVANFKKEAAGGHDPEIKNFAAQTLPVIEGHLNTIQSIQSKMGSSPKGM